MLAPYASILVNQGVLKVLGEGSNPVLLVPKDDLTGEYGSTSIKNATVFDGIWFGPKSTGTVLGDGKKYVDGSILRHCIMNFGGYFSNVLLFILTK